MLGGSSNGSQFISHRLIDGIALRALRIAGITSKIWARHFINIASAQAGEALLGKAAQRQTTHAVGHADGWRRPDEVGTEFPDDHAARLQAVVCAGETMRDEPAYVWKGGEVREMTAAGGALLFTIVIQAIDAPAAADLELSDRNRKTGTG